MPVGSELNVLHFVPFDAVVGGDGPGCGGGIEAEEGPGAGDPGIAGDHRFVHADAQAGGAGDDQVAALDGERVFQDLAGYRKWIHRFHCGRGVDRVLQPLDYRVRPADTQVGGGDHFEVGAPAMESESQAGGGDFGEEAPAHGEASLAADVHLHVVYGLGEDQIEVAL